MRKDFSIIIRGVDNPKLFVERWSSIYSYPNDDKYKNHINNGLSNQESFLELFKWKNGTGDVISNHKMTVVLKFWEKVDVLRELSVNFNWDIFEKEFEPHKNSTIWKIFLLHLTNKQQFPIFDQHVFRSCKFITTGKIDELPKSSLQIYHFYKSEYRDWFNQIQKEYDLDYREMDQSFFSYGRMLKKMKNYPFEIHSEG